MTTEPSQTAPFDGLSGNGLAPVDKPRIEAAIREILQLQGLAP